MRSPKFIVLSLSLLLFLDVFACGDWASDAGNVLLYRIMPLDETDYYDYLTTWSSDQMLHRKVETIIGRSCKRVLGNKRHIVSFVIHHND